ncbi:MAG TPA: hypothetical protein GX505_03890 [Clostridiales bacterium]|nr:hypothetical protein [Clostridiales bacterium]
MKRQRLPSLVLLLSITLFAYVFIYFVEDISSASAAADSSVSSDVCRQLDMVGGTLQQIHINGWAEMRSSYFPLPVLIEKAKELMPLLGDNLQVQVSTGETPDYRQVKLTTGENGIDYSLILSSSRQPDNETPCHQTFIIINAVLDADSIELEEEVHGKLNKILSQFDSSPSLSTTYTAAIPGRLKESEMEQAGRQIFNKLNGRVTEMSRDAEWISLTGYSSRIKGELHSKNGRFNMNVALRYNAHEGKTYIWLGTPVISIPY